MRMHLQGKIHLIPPANLLLERFVDLSSKNALLIHLFLMVFLCQQQEKKTLLCFDLGFGFCFGGVCYFF